MAFDAPDTRSFPTRPRGASRGFANWMKTGVLLAAMTALIIVVGGMIGGSSGVIIAGGFALVSNFVAYWFSDKIALAVHGAREVGPGELPWYHEIVERLASRAGLPKPRLYVIQSPTPNAFATGRDPAHAAVAVTTGIVQLLDQRELEGVLAHELSHVRNRDTLIATVAASIAGAIAGVAHMLQWAALFGGLRRDDDDEGGGGIVGMLALIILAPLAATVLQLAISRSREYGADATGGELCGDPGALADALSKLEYGNRAIPNDAHPQTASLFIVNPLSGRALLSLFSTHPPTEERVRRLRAMSRAF
jgi:heat shock protein HtpX